MLRRHGLTAACALSLLLSACGGDGGGTDDEGYLPLATGNRWVFDDGEDTTVGAQRSVGGQAWWVVADTFDPANETLLRSDAQGVIVRSDAAITGFSEYRLIKSPAVSGERFVDGTFHYTSLDYDRNGTADDIEITLAGSTVGTEAVNSPAGAFADALHTRFTITSTITYRPSGERAPLASSTLDTWYARGVGPVKSSWSDTDPTGAVTSGTSLLTGYRAGGRTDGTLPPR